MAFRRHPGGFWSDSDHRVSIRVSARARRIALRIDAAERKVELVLPQGVPASHGLRFLAAKQGWIAARLAALPQPVRFAEGDIIPVLGVPHRIRREDDAAAPPVVIRDGEIRVRGDPAHIKRRVRDHLPRCGARRIRRPGAAPRGADRTQAGAGRGT